MTTELELLIRSEGAAVEADDRLATILFVHGSTGSFLEESSEPTLHAFFSDQQSRATATEALRAGGWEARPIDRPREDWLGRYQQSLLAFPVGERFLIAPERELLSDPGDRIPLVIPQEHGFGTGSHETTALCLEMLERIPMEGRRGLDIGTGSGILAIAMVVLGANRVVAFDNDLDALGVVSRNVSRNGLDPTRLRHFIGGIEPLRPGSYDVVTMNIVPEVILLLLPQVRMLIGETGRLVVSGVLSTRAAEVVEAAWRSELGLEREQTAGEWWCGMFANPSPIIGRGETTGLAYRPAIPT